VRRTYGADKVALVATISTLRPKSAVRETAKAYGLEEVRIKRLVGLLPRRWHSDPRRGERRSVEEIVAEVSDPREQEVRKLTGAVDAIRDKFGEHSIRLGGTMLHYRP